MVDAIKPLYTAHGTAIGGRNGEQGRTQSILLLAKKIAKQLDTRDRPVLARSYNRGSQLDAHALGF